MNIQSKEYILTRVKEFCAEISEADLETKVDLINQIRSQLHEISPFKTEPVDFVEWVKNDTVHANTWNPNTVAPVEMELLKLSIQADGYTQPIVSFKEDDGREVVDGYHRNKVGKTDPEIQARIHGYLPVVTINDDRSDKNSRIASTIRHNRARGKHSVTAMSDIVIDLKKRNWNDAKIAKHLGMDADEVLRLSVITGLTDAFKNAEFSQAWEIEPQPIESEEIDG